MMKRLSTKPRFLFEEMHPDELKDVVKNSGIIFLPLGTLEWHERHLPFGLDAFVSYEICKAVCKKTGGCVLPPLYFGTDREHTVKGKRMHGMDAKVGKILPGSIYFLQPVLFYEVIKSIAANIAGQGLRKLAVVSAHSGTAQHRALQKLSKEKIKNLKILVFPGRNFPGGIDHAGKIETNLLLKIRKELVQLKKLKKPYTGIMGDDPKDSQEEEGQKQFSSIVREIEKEILQG